MASSIDATIPVAGERILAAPMRANFAAAKAEIEALQAEPAGVADGDKGDITVSGTGTIWTIDATTVTLAKMANLAQDQFIGRVTTSTGVPETATITAAARTVLDDTSVAAMVDTLGGASATGTGGIVRAAAPTMSGVPVIAGALSFTGSDTTTFTTPVGTNVGTKIGLQLINLAEFAQLVIMGVPSGAHVNSRVFSLIDARTTAHQQTLAVFSPDETDLIGFSWDGSNTEAYLKTLAAICSIRVGTTNLARFQLDGATSKIGFFGVAPAARPAAYTPTNVVADRAYDANATTVDELADVLGTLIADLQTLGLLS